MRPGLTRQMMLVMTVVVSAVGVVGSLHSGALPGNGSNWSLGLVAVGYSWLGWMVAGRRPELPIGWLLLAGGVVSAMAFTADWWATEALFVDRGSLPGGPVAAWAATGLNAIPTLLVLVAPLILFPTGRPRSGRWRRFMVGVGATVGALAAGALVMAIPAAIGSNPASLLDLPGVDKRGWGGAATGAESIARLLAQLAALVALFGVLGARQRAAGEERRAYTTVVYGMIVVVVVSVAGALVGPFTSQRHQAPEELYSFALLCLPAAIVVAIARFRVYEIRTAVSRSALVALVGASLTLVYLVTLGLFAALVHRAQAFTVPSMLAACVVVVATSPIAAAGRRRATRRWFGRSADGGGVAARFAGLVRADADAPGALRVLAETMRDELRLGSVELTVEGLVCVVGTPDPPVTSIPLEYASAPIGAVAVTARPGEVLGPRDLRLLTEVGRYVAVAAHAIRTSEELRRAQHAIETAHVEERRRLRRDLHDGIAPTLASIRLKLTAFRRATGDHAVDDVIDQVADTIREVRRIVDGLQPSVLEDLGLLPALEILVADTRQAAAINVALDAPPSLPELPADAADTAYRVVSEALANVMRHSQASSCTVRVQHVGAMLDVEVRDDGCGFQPNGRGGMGLRSIATRASLANGSATVTSAPGAGTTVSLRVPT